MTAREIRVHLGVTVPEGNQVIVIDKAATACRIAYSNGCNSFTLASLSTTVDSDIVEFVKSLLVSGATLKLYIVGIGANSLCNSFADQDITAVIKPKFNAKVKGFYHGLENIENFIQKFDDALPVPPFIPGFKGHVKEYPSLLCLTGATTSYVIINEDGSYEALRSSYGGRDFVRSLGKCLTQSDENLVQLAETGNQYKVTVCMDEVSGPKTDNVGDTNDFLKMIPFRMEIFPFGRVIQEKVYDPESKDVAKALMHSIAEDITSNIMLIWESYNVKNVYLGGSLYEESTVLRKCMERVSYQVMGTKSPPTPRFCKLSDDLAIIGVLSEELKKIL